ncbi:MAG: YraN family protein [Clostridia bacterium]|nr:YraN family protein [Clostridia bacterium]
MVKEMVQKNSNKRSFGNAGEKIAIDFLIKNGYSILAHSYRVGRLGEIDIIARENEYLCFIEVKARSSTLFGTPSEAVSRKKQATIIKLAQIYMSNNALSDSNVRFDVVEVIVNKSKETTNVKEINLIRNAF